MPFLCASALGLHIAAPSPARAQDGEARVLFERGNQHLAAGLRGRGARRDRELQEALDAYLGVLRLGARTRNVVFNLGLVSQELGRANDAYNFYSEYLRTFDLSDEDRAVGEERLAAMRPQVAVLSITSAPQGAEVRIDRSDLPVRGVTPLDLAVAPGAHRVLLVRDGFEDASIPATATTGTRETVHAQLVAEPVMVQVIAPSRGRLTLDDAEIVAGRAVPVPPGPHVVRLEVPGVPPIERRFEVQAGTGPMTLELSAPASAVGARIVVEVDTYASLFLDGIPLGTGRRVQAPAFPGPHALRVEAPGFNPATHAVTIGAEEQVSLHVEMGPAADGSGLDAARGLTGIVAALGLVAAGAIGINALILGDEYDQAVAARANRLANNQPMTETAASLQARADEVESWLLGADVALAVTAALGVTAIVLLVVDAGDGEASTVTVGAAPHPGGGVVSLSGRWGQL